MIWFKRTAIGLAALVALVAVLVVVLFAFGGAELCTARDTADQVPQCHSVH